MVTAMADMEATDTVDMEAMAATAMLPPTMAAMAATATTWARGLLMLRPSPRLLLRLMLMLTMAAMATVSPAMAHMVWATDTVWATDMLWATAAMLPLPTLPTAMLPMPMPRPTSTVGAGTPTELPCPVPRH